MWIESNQDGFALNKPCQIAKPLNDELVTKMYTIKSTDSRNRKHDIWKADRIIIYLQQNLNISFWMNNLILGFLLAKRGQSYKK